MKSLRSKMASRYLSLSPILSFLLFPPLFKPGCYLRKHLTPNNVLHDLGNLNIEMKQASKCKSKQIPKSSQNLKQAFSPQNSTYHDASQQKNSPQDALNQHKQFPQPWLLRRSQKLPKSDTVLGQPLALWTTHSQLHLLQEMVLAGAFICFSVCTYVHIYMCMCVYSTPFPCQWKFVKGEWVSCSQEEVTHLEV